MGLSGMPVDELAAWVAESCADQGLPVKVTDVTVVRRVCVLLGGQVGGLTRAGAEREHVSPPPARLQPPHDVHAATVDAAGSCLSRLDRDVIDHRGDDGVLSGKVQLLPRPA